MTKFSNKFKKTLILDKIWPIFLIFPIFRKKLMSQSRGNFRTEEWKDGQTLIHRTLPATVGGLIRRTDI